KRVRFDLNIQSLGSLGGLVALQRGECHLAGCHLLDPRTGDYNLPYLKRYFPNRDMVLLNLVNREQGLLVKKGNPLQIDGLRDLIQKGATYCNRQRGAGTRALLDYLLQQEGLNPEQLKGYGKEEYTHIAAALAVASGSADAALGIKAAASAMELDFIPLAEERYDLALPSELLSDDRLVILRELISSKEFKMGVKELGGYRTEKSGELLRQNGVEK
ncbi:MAG: substrate-binding domain-containing protein, partial [Halanaerobium sp.]|nr:substrate-binding domain-containing protein [Halanaerobium sp.]